MLISARDAAASYKALEKEETRAMEAVLARATGNAPGPNYKTTILTRPANPMRSMASWLLWLCIGRGEITGDGLGIHVPPGKLDGLLEVASIVWQKGEGGILLLAATDGSVVVGRTEPKAGGITFLPLALQLRGTLKDVEGRSTRQKYRRGDGWSLPEGIFLERGDNTINLLDEGDTISASAATWRRQIEIEMQALFAYQAERPLIGLGPRPLESIWTTIGMGVLEEIRPGEMSFLSREVLHPAHRHLGYRSFSPEKAEILKEGLVLALRANLTPEGREALMEHSVIMVAGCPYTGRPAHIAAEPLGMTALLTGYGRDQQDEVLSRISRALAPLFEALRPEGMSHNRQHIKSAWTLCEIMSEPTSNHDRIVARQKLDVLIKEVISTSTTHGAQHCDAAPDL